MKPQFERLPKSVAPSHYDLHLQPDLINFTFVGSVKTSIKVSRINQTVDLHIPVIVKEKETSHPAIRLKILRAEKF